MDPSLFWERDVELSSRPLNLIGAPHSVECARELDEEGVAHCLDFSAHVSFEDGPGQPSLFIDKRQRQRLALLSQSRVPNHVRKHDRRKSSMLLGQARNASFLRFE